jgi:hypothetical protein
MNNMIAAAIVAALAVPLPTPKPAEQPPAAPPVNPFLEHERDASLPVVRVHSWYDWTCCASNDCAPIKADDVTATDRGWFVRRTGETLPYEGDVRVKKSQDEDFHLCILPSTPNNIRCLYVPPMGF